jgi:hypothetical protein
MVKAFIAVSISVLIVNIAACSNEKDDHAALKADPVKKSLHSDVSTTAPVASKTPVADALKKKMLNANSSKTVGEAFDSYKYLASKEWRETAAQNGIYYVDYICWLNVNSLSRAALKEGIVKRGLEIKFVVHEDGAAYIAMATRIDIKSDGKVYSTQIDPGAIEKIVSAIYENREITF